MIDIMKIKNIMIIFLIFSITINLVSASSWGDLFGFFFNECQTIIIDSETAGLGIPGAPDHDYSITIDKGTYNKGESAIATFELNPGLTWAEKQTLDDPVESNINFYDGIFDNQKCTGNIVKTTTKNMGRSELEGDGKKTIQEEHIIDLDAGCYCIEFSADVGSAVPLYLQIEVLDEETTTTTSTTTTSTTTPTTSSTTTSSSTTLTSITTSSSSTTTTTIFICSENESKDYICPDRSEVPWCFCINNTWTCILSPESLCSNKTTTSTINTTTTILETQKNSKLSFIALSISIVVIIVIIILIIKRKNARENIVREQNISFT